MLSLGAGPGDQTRRRERISYAHELKQQIDAKKEAERRDKDAARIGDYRDAVERSQVATGIPVGAGRRHIQPPPAINTNLYSSSSPRASAGGDDWAERIRQISPQKGFLDREPRYPPPQQQQPGYSPTGVGGGFASRQLMGGDGDPAEAAEIKAARRREQQDALRLQLEAKQEQQRREKEERLRPPPEYNPFGRGGAGAPLRDSSGQTLTQLRGAKPAPREANLGSTPTGASGLQELPNLETFGYGLVPGFPPPPSFQQQPPPPPSQQQQQQQQPPPPQFGGYVPSFATSPSAAPGGGGGDSHLRFRVDHVDPQTRDEMAARMAKQMQQQAALKAQMEEAARVKAEAKARKQQEEKEEEDRLAREREKLRQDYEKEESEKKRKEQLKEEQRQQAEEARRNKALAAQAEREKDRLADEKARRQHDEALQKSKEPPSAGPAPGAAARQGSARAPPPSSAGRSRIAQHQQPDFDPYQQQQQQQPFFQQSPASVYSPSGHQLSSLRSPGAHSQQPPAALVGDLANQIKREVLNEARREFQQQTDELKEELARQRKQANALRDENLAIQQERDAAQRELNRARGDHRVAQVEEFERLKEEVGGGARVAAQRRHPRAPANEDELDLQQQSMLRLQESELRALRSTQQVARGGRDPFNQSLSADSRLVYPDGHSSVLEHIRPVAETPEPVTSAIVANMRPSWSRGGGGGGAEVDALYARTEARLKDLDSIGRKKDVVDPDEVDELLSNFLRQRSKAAPTDRGDKSLRGDTKFL